jgi:hypothetical protein
VTKIQNKEPLGNAAMQKILTPDFMT